MVLRSLAALADPARHTTGRALKALVWLFCALLLLATWFFVVQQIRFERQQAIDEAVAQNINRVIGFEQYVQRTLEVASISTRYVADRFQRGAPGTEFAGTPARPALMRGNLARDSSTFVAILITNADGDVIGSSISFPPNTNISRFPSFRVHLARDSGQLYVSRPFRSPFTGRELILLSRRLNNPDGSFAGIVALAIAPEQFTAFYRDARVGENDVMSLIGLDGITRARRTGAIASSGEDLRGGLVMRRQMENPNGTYLGPSMLDGQVRYFSHRRLPNYPLFATYGILESEVLALPQRRASVLIGAAAFATLVTIGFAALLTVLVNRGQRRTVEIAAQNERLEEAQRIAEMGDWRYDVRTQATEWSPQTFIMHERDPALGPIPPDEYRALLNETGRAAVDRAVSDVFKTGADQEFELKLHLPSGVEAWHQVSAVAVRDAAGKVTGLRGTSQDITARKRLEQLETRVAHFSRIEAMNAMAATLAHELNQPLAAAANFLVGSRRKLVGASPSPAEADEGLRAAEQQIHFAGDIIRRVRELVSNPTKAISNFSLSTVVDDAAALVASAAGREIGVSKDLGSEARRARGDRVQIQQVLINLIRNAVTATEGRAEAEILVSSRLDGDQVVVSIADNGPGFGQPRAARFSSFSNGAGSGLGLGLSISRTIIESNGGRIWTEDPQEGGARVSFTLPVAQAGKSRERAGEEPELVRSA